MNNKKDKVYQVFNRTYDKAVLIGKSKEQHRIATAINELIQFHDETGLHENEGAMQTLEKLRSFVNSKHRYLTH